jgi:integrase
MITPFDYYRTNRRPRSVKRHETSWNVIKPVLGQRRLAKISAFDLERYRRNRKQAGKSDVTINRELAFLRNLFSMAITWGKVTENPVKKIKFAREKNQRIRFLTHEEEARLLDQCGPQLKPLVVTALHTGFRRSELLSLTWQDVDFRRKVITVRAAYAKNGESRSVPMNEILLSTLKTCKINHPPGEHVFWTHKGTPYRSYRSAFE